MDMRMAQFWSGRSIPLGWTRWNPFWTLILVLMVAESAGEANGAAGAADHGLSNIYSGTLRAARYGKRSTGEWERIQEEIVDLKGKERDADERLRVANEELGNLTQQLTTANGEKAMADNAVNLHEGKVNRSRKVYDDSERFTRVAQNELDESILAMKTANSTVSTLLAEALGKFTGTAEYRESLETKYGRFECDQMPNVQGTLVEMANNISALEDQQNADAEVAKATKERDDLDPIYLELRAVEKAQTDLCDKMDEVVERTGKLGKEKNKTTALQKTFETNVREYNKSLDAAALVQEKLDKINASMTRASGDKDAATTELADVRQKLRQAEAKRDNFVAAEPATGTSGTGTPAAAEEEKSSGFVGSVAFWILLPIAVVALCTCIGVFFHYAMQ